MTAWDFAAMHPGWMLVYVGVVSFAAVTVAASINQSVKALATAAWGVRVK